MGSHGEDWVYKTYGLGTQDAVKDPLFKKENPDRVITFIHRQHQTTVNEILTEFKPLLNVPEVKFIFSFKYAYAHLYASTTPQLYKDFASKIGNHKTMWTLRNDDVFINRWGSPDFVREFIKNIPKSPTEGIYVGSDNYIWGREFMSKEPESPRQLEVDKHWYHWLLWGRLAYDPDVPSQRFKDILKSHFNLTDVNPLYTAWQEASLIYPEVTRYHWNDGADYKWYIECCSSQPGDSRGDGAYGYNAGKFTANNQQDNLKLSPAEVEASLNKHADKALDLIKQIDPMGNKELRLTLWDIRTIAYMGKFYANKVGGDMKAAAKYWRLYTASILAQNKESLWLNRTGRCDWRIMFGEALKDAGGSITSIEPTSGGTVFEAEDAVLAGGAKASATSGFTGTGYVNFSKSGDITWTVNVPAASAYALEFRYATTEQADAAVVVNGKTTLSLPMWSTSSRNVWAWDQIAVELKSGANTLKLSPKVNVSVDHLNVLSLGTATTVSRLARPEKSLAIDLLSSEGLTFSLPQSGQARVRIYDRQGRLVYNLSRQFSGTGKQRVDFSQDILGQGMYILKLESGKDSMVRSFHSLKR